MDQYGGNTTYHQCSCRQRLARRFASGETIVSRRRVLDACSDFDISRPAQPVHNGTIAHVGIPFRRTPERV